MKNARLVASLLCLVFIGCGDDDGPADAMDMADSIDTPDTVEGDMMVTPDADAMVEEMCPVPVDPPCDALEAGPAPLNEHVAAYFADRREMVVFGGNTAVPVNCGFPAWTYEDTTWVYYDYANECGSWTKVEGAGPSARGRHAAANSDSKMWVFGGRFRTAGTTGPYTVLNDFWEYDSATRTWKELPSGPPGRFNSGMVYDENNEKLWLWAGNASTSGATPSVQDDLWSYDIASETWSQVSVAGPTPRMWHTMTFDSLRNRVVVYGGGNESAFTTGTYFADAWGFDVTAMRWNVLHDGVNQPAPVGRFWGSIIHDKKNDRYVLFGGHDATNLGNRNDTWILDPNTNNWEPVFEGDTFNKPARGMCDFPADFATIDAASPERRNAASFVYSLECDRAILFGGKTDCGAINDVWRYSERAWEGVFSSGAGEVCLRAGGTLDNCSSICF